MGDNANRKLIGMGAPYVLCDWHLGMLYLIWECAVMFNIWLNPTNKGEDVFAKRSWTVPKAQAHQLFGSTQSWHVSIQTNSTLMMLSQCELYSVSFFVARNSQISNQPLPAPTNKEVRLEALNKTIVAVLSFGGHANDMVWNTKAAELRNLLQISGYDYDKENCHFVIPDGPFQMKRRNNEIWIEIWLRESTSDFMITHSQFWRRIREHSEIRYSR